MSAAYIRDERGIGGTTTRAAVLDYTDAQGRMLRVRSMLPGDEACARLEDQMAYIGSDALIADSVAVQLRSGDLSRIYTLIGQAVYCLEGELPLGELTELAGSVVIV